jgi:hypothetical protein
MSGSMSHLAVGPWVGQPTEVAGWDSPAGQASISRSVNYYCRKLAIQCIRSGLLACNALAC